MRQVKLLARRKIVFIIVEGPSDETALGVALNNIFDEESVYLHIIHGDITTRKRVSAQNIVAKIGDEIKQYARDNHFKPDDFRQIIHIVDTDACYLNEDKVIEDLSLDRIVYQGDGIYTKDVDKIKRRNQQKTDNLYRLSGCGEIWKIPYRIYYMSCNLDHVLFNKRNNTDEGKERDAFCFAKKYKNDKAGFLEFMCESEFSVKSDYNESWRFIETGDNSIKRYSNLAICLQEA